MHELDSRIKWPKDMGYFCNFLVTTQSENWPNLVTLAKTLDCCAAVGKCVNCGKANSAADFSQSSER
jgi:hypothetical protein